MNLDKKIRHEVHRRFATPVLLKTARDFSQLIGAAAAAIETQDMRGIADELVADIARLAKIMRDCQDAVCAWADGMAEKAR